jgi:hypothetical protein
LYIVFTGNAHMFRLLCRGLEEPNFYYLAIL